MCRWRSALNYLAGLVYGDGSIYYYKRNNEYFVFVYDENYEFLRRVGEEIRRALGVNYSIVKPTKRHNYYRLQFTSKRVYDYVRELLMKRPRSLTKNFVRGIIDAEGTLFVDSKGRIAFELGMTNYTIIARIRKWLKARGIHATLTVHRDKRPGRRPIYKLHIRGWDNVEYFISYMKPLHPKIYLKFQRIKQRKAF